MPVLEDEHDGPFGGQPRHVPAHGGEDLLAHGVRVEISDPLRRRAVQRQPDEGREEGEDTVGLAPEKRSDPTLEFLPARRLGLVLGDARVALGDLDERSVADALGDREGPALERVDGSLAAGPFGFGHEPRLSETGVAGNEGDATFAARDRIESLDQRGELGRTTDQRRAEPDGGDLRRRA